jgi:phenylalanyl-tRNA synthetase alpha chain
MTMALPEYLASLDALAHDAEQAFQNATTADAVEAARVEFLGAKNGRLKTAQKGLGTVAPDEKPAAGTRFHEVKGAIEAAFEAAQTNLTAARTASPVDPTFDVTLPGKRLRLGKLHPITQTIEELKDIMGRLGFTPQEGPEIEDEWHNFQALNIPQEHPSRDPLENFYLSTANIGSAGGPLLLRSQTSTVQIRVMEAMQPPIRIISLGRVYRPDDVDETHYPMFHQMEGLLIDRHVTMADLKSVLRLFAQTYLGSDVQVRFRPSFFPFTEPSVEVDMRWGERWMEFGGAGMVDPNVLRAVGYDPEQVTGFAFGLGVERLCMRRHQITDIRELFKNDVRFLQQF